MGRNGFLTVIFFFFIVPEVSNASFALKFRSLVGLAPIDNSTASTVKPPVPSPVSIGNESKSEPVNADKPKKNEPKDTQVHNKSSKVDSKGSNKTGAVSPPTGKEKSEAEIDTKTGTSENCDKLPKRCTHLKKMVACIQVAGSGDLVLLVQNEGEITLKVNLTVPTSSEFASKELKIPKHQTEKINISLSVAGSTKIVLNAGNENCVLHECSVSDGSFFN